MFDAKYYADKKTKLSQKAQQLQQEYLQGAFKFTNEMNDIQLEFNKINEKVATTVESYSKPNENLLGQMQDFLAQSKPSRSIGR